MYQCTEYIVRKMQNEIRYFSMFTGVGGFELGIERANSSQSQIQESETKQDSSNFSRNDVERTTFNCIGCSEIDKFSSELLKKRFPKTKNYGDATKIISEELPDFDLLVGGFPCQTFSIAGKRKGFEDTRGTLFFDIARILKVKRPRNILLENVKGLLSHDRGRTFTTIISTLAELGYVVQWMVLNSKFFGVPQNRERVFIIGSLREKPIPEILPFRETSGEFNQRNTEEQVASSLQHPGHSGGNYRGMTMIHNVYGGFGEGIREFDISPTLRTPKGGGHLPMVVASRGRNPKNPSDRTVGSPTEQILEPNSEGISNTLSSVQKDNMVMEDMKIRRLTPTECERLQGFPDGWTEGFSDTQRYKMMGNAVTVNVIQAVVGKMFAKERRKATNG